MMGYLQVYLNPIKLNKDGNEFKKYKFTSFEPESLLQKRHLTTAKKSHLTSVLKLMLYLTILKV